MQKRMIKYLVLFILLPLLTNCNSKKNEDNEVVKEYKINNDSVIEKGIEKNGLRSGIWKYSDLDENLLEIVEFKIINNESYYNQAIRFNKNNDTIFDRTSFYKFNYTNDTILNINFVSLLDKLYEGKNTIILLYNKNINEDFSNLNELNLDTLFFNNKYAVQFINKSKKFRGIIREIHLRKSDSISLQRDVYVDINLKSKNFPED